MPEGRIQGRRTGFATIVDPLASRPHERETFGCGHCQHVTVVEHGQSLDALGGMCFACMRPCCKECVSLFQLPPEKGGGCDVFEKKLDRGEKRAEAARVNFSTELERRINAQASRSAFLDYVDSNHLPGGFPSRGF